jgi:L-proline amide hydrolase
MKNYKKFLKRFSLVTLGLLLTGLLFPTWTPGIEGKDSVSVYDQVSINGTNHQLMIRGADKNNPIIIFVHGGPGYSEIPYGTV